MLKNQWKLNFYNIESFISLTNHLSVDTEILNLPIIMAPRRNKVSWGKRFSLADFHKTVGATVSSLGREETPADPSAEIQPTDPNSEMSIEEIVSEFVVDFDVAIDNSVNGGRVFAFQHFARSMVSSAVGFGKKLFS